MNDYQMAAELITSFYQKNKELILSTKIYSDSELKAKYSNFYKKFSPEALSIVSKEELLEKVFDDLAPSEYEVNAQKSMMFALISNSLEFYGDLGHVGTQYRNNLSLYRSGQGWKLGREFRSDIEFMSKSEAENFAYKIRNGLVSALRGLSSESLVTIEDYQRISNVFTSKTGSRNVQAWFHKYLHLIFPESFPQFHTTSYKRTLLDLFNIKPVSDDPLEISWQINQIYKNSEIPDPYTFAKTFYSIKGLIELVKGDKNYVRDNLAIVQNNLKEGVTASVTRTASVVIREPKSRINNITVIEEVPDPSIEADYIDSVSCLMSEKIQEYPVAGDELPQFEIRDGVKRYIRDPKVSAYALQKANYACEFDCEHPTFTRKTDGKPYMEPHHIIPISQQPSFPDKSLDVPANIISLCSNCHNRIHYATFEEKKELLMKIIQQRKDQLEEAGILVNIMTLFEMYK